MDETEPSPDASRSPPAPIPAPRTDAFAPKRLYRDPNGKVGGVASGLAAYFDIDPVITRLCFVVALLSGIGFFAYIVCWIVIPKAPFWPPPGHTASRPSDAEPRGWNSVTSGLLVLALAALVGTGLDGVADFLLPAALLGFGVYLLNQRPDGAPRGVPGPSDEGAGAEQSGPSEEGRGLVTPTVLSVLALGLGVALALQAAGVVVLSVVALSAAGVVVVALGLLASLRFGRATALIPVGLVLGAVLLFASVVVPRINQASNGALDGLIANGIADHSFGDSKHKPRALEDLQPKYKLGVGTLKLDLRHLDLEGQTREVNADLGVGDFKVILPKDVSVLVTGRVGFGEITGKGQRTRDGKSSRVELEKLLDGPGKLIVNFNVGLGGGRVVYGK